MIVDTTNSIRVQPTLLSLPVEVRLQMYSHLVNCTGVISVFAHYTMEENTDLQTKNLLQVCRVMRREVQDLFYRHQVFEFRSYAGIKGFCKILKPYHVSIIKSIEIGMFLCRRGLDNFVKEVCHPIQKHFTGVEKLTINDPNLSFIIPFHKDGVLGHEPHVKAEALREHVTAFDAAKLYCTYSKPEIEMMPGFFQERGNTLEKVVLVMQGCDAPGAYEIDHPRWVDDDYSTWDSIPKKAFYQVLVHEEDY